MIVIKEFPIIIQNHLRLPELQGGYFLLDYYFPNLSLCVELDSDLHYEKKDDIRDNYLSQLGIEVYRIRHFERPDVQSGRFKELTKKMREMTPTDNPKIFSFTDNIRLAKGL